MSTHGRHDRPNEIVSIATLTSDPPSIEFRRAMHRRRWLRGFKQPGANGHPLRAPVPGRSSVLAGVRAPLDALIKEGRVPALDGSAPAAFPPPEFFRPWLATEKGPQTQDANGSGEESLDGHEERRPSDAESSTSQGAANTGPPDSRFSDHRARIDAARAQAKARNDRSREQEEAEERSRYQEAANTETLKKTETPEMEAPEDRTPKELRRMNARDLLALELPPLVEHIKGLLPEGLGVIAAPPKAGKSRLLYQMAAEIALRGRILDISIEESTAVLYYALEDGQRRSQKRLRLALKGRTSGVENIDLEWAAPKLGSGLEEEIAEWLDGHPHGVVFVDVLATVRPRGRGRANAYDEDYELLTRVHHVAKTHPGSTILFVTHDRKAGSDDWVARITGTRGVSGAADFVIFISRQRTESFGTIHMTGRDIPDAVIDANFSEDEGWERATMRDRVGQGAASRQVIYDWVAENGPAWPAEIATGTGLTHDVAKAQALRMAKDGQLRKVAAGYEVAGDGGGEK